MEILRQWLEEQKTGIIANYNAKGRKASGRFERETYVQMDINKGAIMSPRYAGVMLFGRRANFNQDPKSIRSWVGWAGSTILKEWVQNKGLSINPFAVAYNIARKGIAEPTQPNGLVTEVVNEDAIKELGMRLAKDITVRCAEYRDWETDRKSTRLNSSHSAKSRMPSSA